MRSFPRPDINRAEAWLQFVQLLANATDEKILALTIERVMAMYRVDRREAETKLLATQANIRRRMGETV